MLKSIDLFAGIGGIRLGFEQAFGRDLKTIFVSEWDEYAQRTYKANFNDDFEIAGDITKISEKDIPDFDICLAGFPCQAFSLAGQRKGFEDNYKGMSRGTLFFDVARICEAKKPKVIFCENVKGLTIHDKGRTFKIITETLKEIGYKPFEKVLNSRDFGVPQNRERIYIVAFRNDIAPEEFEFPHPTDTTKRISNILEGPVPAKYYLSECYLETLKRHKARHEALGHGFGYEIRDWDDVAGAIVCGGMGRERNLIIDKRQTDLTPTTHIKGDINKEGVRKMTPREWARLQGFPDSYKLVLADVHLYKQFGNSVTVPVIKAIAEKVKEVLDMPAIKGKNKGEWSEMYIFFKLMSDRRVYVADKDMNKLKDVFLDIISIIREEDPGKEYRYYTGDTVKITLNGVDVKSLDSSLFTEKAVRVWKMITENKGNTTFTDDEIRAFLESIFVRNISAPAQKKNDYFGGTKDIVLDTHDYRSGVDQIMGFSCKSDIDAASTLFNASGDNTNFEYELVGNVTDGIMDRFNSMYKEVIRKGRICQDVATGERMNYLKSCGVDVKFVQTAKQTAGQNLIRCGGLETPLIVAEMLRYYYYNKSGTDTSVEEAIHYLADKDVISYGFGDLYDTYHLKAANLLYSMFTGLRFSKPWNGKSDVSGGYIVVKRDGDVVAFHSCIADKFKDFLVDKLRFEAPSCSRHNYMSIYKKTNGKYYLKFALQFRFKLKK